MYQLSNNANGEPISVIRLLDNLYIPIDDKNTDYQEYLKWLSKGNTPIPAKG